jgi:magnesium-transporting ATPase (P-type)
LSDVFQGLAAIDVFSEITQPLYSPLQKSGICRASGPDQTSTPTQVAEPELDVPGTTPPQLASLQTPPTTDPDTPSTSAPEDNFPAWARTIEECAEHYAVNLKRGLTSAQVEAYREAYGWNELEKEPGKPFWGLVAEQFDDALVKILLGAAAVSGALAVWDATEAGEPVGADDFLETLVILLIIVLNAVIGVWQESKAESTLAALKEMQSETARVVRDGREVRPGGKTCWSLCDVS